MRCVPLVLAIVVFAGCGGQAGRRTTASGDTLWQFEALLHDTFGKRPVCASGRWAQNFTAGSCAPLAMFAPYSYVFVGARGSRFHVTSTKALDFGNYPQPVLIRGRNVACDRDERTFLISYVNMASLTLSCSRAGFVRRVTLPGTSR